MGCSGVQGVWAAAVRGDTPILSHFYLLKLNCVLQSPGSSSFLLSSSRLLYLNFPHPFPVFKNLSDDPSCLCCYSECFVEKKTRDGSLLEN